MLMRSALAAAAILILSGCESSVTLENYDKIQDGMTIAEVEAFMGNGRVEKASGTSLGTGGLPERSEDDMDRMTYVWGEEGGAQIIVVFADGEVASKRKLGL